MSDNQTARNHIKTMLFLSSAMVAWLGYIVDGTGTAWIFGGVWFVVMCVVLFSDDARDNPDTKRDTENSGGFAEMEQISAAGFLSGEGIPFGWFNGQWLKYNGENHLITVGPPGSGKFTNVIAPVLLSYPNSCIVIDPKGEAAAVTTRARRELKNKVFHLNPYGVFSERLGKSARFNPLATLDPQNINFIGDVRSLAQAIIVDTGGKDSHWPDAARELVTCLIMHVCTNPNEVKTLPRVRSLLMLPRETPEPNEGREKNPDFIGVVAEMMASPYAPVAELATQFAHISEEMESILSTAKVQTAWLHDTAIRDCLSGSDFDFSKLREEKITVFLILPAKHLDAQARWLRVLIIAAIDAMTAKEKGANDSRVLFMLDEFAQLGRLPAIEKGLGLVRGYGVQLWPFLQDLNQLQDLYEKRWASFMSTAGVEQFFTPNDEKTSGHIVEKAGKVIVKRRSESQQDLTNTQRRDGATGQSSSESEQWDDLLKKQTLYQMPKNQQIVFTAGSKYTFKLERRFYEDIDGLKPRADSNPFYQ